MAKRIACVLGGLAALHAYADPAMPPADVQHGRQLYQACMACHSVDEDDLGPRHRGVVGRKSGSVPEYSYSPALKASGIVWTPAMLDRWLANPQALVPGTKMIFSLAKEQDRRDVIAYLETLK